MRKLCYTVDNSKDIRKMLEDAKIHRVKFGKRGTCKEFPGGIVWEKYAEAEAYRNSCNNKDDLETFGVKADFVSDTQPIRVGKGEYKGARHLTRWGEMVIVNGDGLDLQHNDSV